MPLSRQRRGRRRPGDSATWLAGTGELRQLRLARAVASDQRLPWERLLCALGSPAAARKPSGRSPGPAHGPLLGACRAVSGDQEARQEAQEEATHDGEGCLTGSVHLPHRRPSSTAGPACRRVKSQAKDLRGCRGNLSRGLPRRNLNTGLARGRLPRSVAVRNPATPALSDRTSPSRAQQDGEVFNKMLLEGLVRYEANIDSSASRRSIPARHLP
jgi:hypothetical protein